MKPIFSISLTTAIALCTEGKERAPVLFSCGGNFSNCFLSKRESLLFRAVGKEQALHQYLWSQIYWIGRADFTAVWIVAFFMRIQVAERLAKGSFYCPKFVIEGALYIKQVAKKSVYIYF